MFKRALQVCASGGGWGCSGCWQQMRMPADRALVAGLGVGASGRLALAASCRARGIAAERRPLAQPASSRRPPSPGGPRLRVRHDPLRPRVPGLRRPGQRVALLQVRARVGVCGWAGVDSAACCSCCFRRCCCRVLALALGSPLAAAHTCRPTRLPFAPLPSPPGSSAITCDPRHYNALYGLGKILLQQEHPEQAVHRFAEAAKVGGWSEGCTSAAAQVAVGAGCCHGLAADPSPPCVCAANACTQPPQPPGVPRQQRAAVLPRHGATPAGPQRARRGSAAASHPPRQEEPARQVGAAQRSARACLRAKSAAPRPGPRARWRQLVVAPPRGPRALAPALAPAAAAAPAAPSRPPPKKT
jgi:hypothetical protein